MFTKKFGTSFQSIVATAEGKATSSSTLVEPSCDVNEENEPVVDQAAATMPPVIGGNLTDTLGNIGDMLDGDLTTADGQIIPRKTMLATACVIFTDFAATYIAFAVIVNINIFGEEFLGYDRAELEKSKLIMSAVDAAFFLLTGCLTDVYGRYHRAIHIYSVISLVGTLILPLLTCSWSVFGPSYVISIPIRRIVYYIARVIISLGVTGINTTAPPMAGMLVQKYGNASVQSCFNYIYMAVRSANLLAVTSLAFVQLNISFFSGYLSTLAFKLLSMYLLFYARKQFQLSIPHNETVATVIVTKTARAIMTKLSTICPCCNCNCCPSLRSSVQSMEEESMELISQRTFKSISTRSGVVDVEKTLTTLSTAAGPSGSALVDESKTTDPSTASTSYGTVDVKASVLSTSVNPSGSGCASVEQSSTVEVSVEERTEALPEAASHALYVCCAILLLSCQVPYSIMRYQISSSYVSQAERMRPTVLGKAVDPALLHQYLPLIGIALAPVFEIYIYPYISKRFIAMTMPTRMKIGIVFATLSVLSAAIVETARMTFIHRGDFFIQDLNNQTVVASNLTLGSLLPQYVLMGGADIFIYITSLEFAFRQSPRSMQAIVTGIFLFYATIGQILGILLVPLINMITAADPWYPHEINDGHLNYYFLALSAMSLTNLIIFCLIEKGYEGVGKYLCNEDTVAGATGGTATMTANITTTTAHNINKKTPTGLPQSAQSAIGTPSTDDR